MRRRALVTSLAYGASLLAGCASRSGPSREPTPAPTPPPDVTTLTETKPLPAPGDVSSRVAARSFVEAYEQRYVYNELVGGFGGSKPAIQISVEPARVAVVHATDRGYYLLSTCRGTARYFDPDGSPSGAGRNASSVAHFVGDGTHRRIPFNGYRCAEPVVPASSDAGTDERAARFQLYDFETEPGYDRPERGGQRVAVSVRRADGTAVVDRDYQTSLPLTVQPRVTTTPGSYRLTATLTDGTTVQHDWSLSTPVGPTWWALALLVTTGGELTVQRLDPNEAVGLPSGSLCTR